MREEASVSSRQSTHSVSPRRAAESRIDRIARICVFQISTGTWSPGQRLPSTREGARQWGVSPLTVLRAYKRLVDMGLVLSAERSGYFVRPGARNDDLTRHASEFDRLHHDVVGMIVDRTDLIPLGVLRRLYQKEAQRLRREPLCAFVECTAYQASTHAREIESRLGLPCLALTTHHCAVGDLPASVGVLLTTGFHLEEVGVVADRLELIVHSVAVEQDPELGRQLARLADDVLILSLDADQAALVAERMRQQAGDKTPALETGASTTDRVEADIAAWLDDPNQPRRGRAVLLSTTLWSSISETWRACRLVRPYAPRICESAWPDLAGAIGMPLGTS